MRRLVVQGLDGQQSPWALTARETPMLDAIPMTGPFGVIVNGLDLRGIDDETLRALVKLLFENRILAIQGQTLTPDDYVAFSRRWGRPIEFINPNGTLSDHPEMIVQSNATNTPELMKNLASHWHCDSSYEEVAATATMLFGVYAPQAGGETLFADLLAAYDALPDAQKRRIRNLEVRHMPGRGTLVEGEMGVTVDRMTPELRQQADKFGPVTHPLVRRHPVTGVLALYGLGGTPYEIVGMDSASAKALLAELKAHATLPRFVQSYKLMPGDVLIWDNFAVMHRATPIAYSDEPDTRRLNYRISVKGVPDVIAHQ